MTTEEYLQWEKEAVERGYKKYNTTSSTNDYSYFKTVGKEDGRFKYMIEWRVWSWHKYIDRDATLKENPYSLEVNIMPDSVKYDMRLDMLIGEPLKFGFDRIEEIAEHYHHFLVEEGIIIKEKDICMDCNELLHKYHPNFRIEMFDKLQELANEARSHVRLIDGYENSDYYYNLYGDSADKLKDLIVNKGKSFVNKLKAYEERTTKKIKKSA